MDHPLRLAIAGFGKIARDQHAPAVAATPGIELVAELPDAGGYWVERGYDWYAGI